MTLRPESRLCTMSLLMVSIAALIKQSRHDTTSRIKTVHDVIKLHLHGFCRMMLSVSSCISCALFVALCRYRHLSTSCSINYSHSTTVFLRLTDFFYEYRLNDDCMPQAATNKGNSYVLCLRLLLSCTAVLVGRK